MNVTAWFGASVSGVWMFCGPWNAASPVTTIVEITIGSEFGFWSEKLHNPWDPIFTWAKATALIPPCEQPGGNPSSAGAGTAVAVSSTLIALVVGLATSSGAL